MSKWLNRGINVVLVLLWFARIISWIAMIEPLGVLIAYFTGRTTTHILTNTDFLMPVGRHTASHAAVASFPAGWYSLAMFLGMVIMLVGALMVINALIKLLHNVLEEAYFTAANVQQLKQILTAQWLFIVGTFLLAVANQLTTSWLYRINTTVNVDWSDVVGSVIDLIIYAVIYLVYSRAVALKTDNDLTV